MNGLITLINELISGDYTLTSVEIVLDAIKEYDVKKYEDIAWALEWNIMTWAEIAEYLRTEKAQTEKPIGLSDWFYFCVILPIDILLLLCYTIDTIKERK